MKKIMLITAVWCPSCLIMRPRYQAYVQKHLEFSFEEVDFDDNPSLVKKLSVAKTLPVAIIYTGEREVVRLIGELSAQNVEEKLSTI